MAGAQLCSGYHLYNGNDCIRVRDRVISFLWGYGLMILGIGVIWQKVGNHPMLILLLYDC